MKYTRALLEDQYKRMRKAIMERNPANTEPIRLFNEDGSFNPDNWGSDQDVVRTKIMYELGVGCQERFDGHGTKNPDKHVFAYTEFRDDQWFIFIHIITDVDKVNSYLVSWYKSRGCTEQILKDGYPITIDEYCEMLNIINDAGYFEKKNWR